MRSFLIIGGLALGVGLLFLQGYVPRQAGAATAPKPVASDRASDLEIKYTDYATEQQLVGDRTPLVTRSPTEPDPEPAVEPVGAAPRPEPKTEPSPADPPPADPSPPPPEATPPVANAGADRTVWIGEKEIALDASASTGDELTFAWRQVAGSHDLKIGDPTAAKTTLSGFADVADPSWDGSDYGFELTVTDSAGQQATATMHLLVKAGPDLTIRPTPKRQLTCRDGYQIAHYESWKTGRGTSAETFELRSSAELFIHHYAGDGVYEVTAAESAIGRTYQITVYYQTGQTTSWVELFVDTPERVPAIIQLGVNWE